MSEKRTVVVTGSGGDIGRGISRALAARGHTVYGLELDDASGERTAELVRADGNLMHHIRCDLADLAQIEAAFARIADDGGKLVGLVNNAARGAHVEPEAIDAATWNGVLAVTLTATAFAAQHAARAMIASGSGGAIVNISSIAGLAALGRGNYAYSVAKHGVVGLTKELAVEWAAHGIRVNAIAPSQVDTSGFRPLVGRPDVAGGGILDTALKGIPLGRLATVDDIVPLVVFLLSDDASFITGVTVPVDGGSMALHAGGTTRPRRKDVEK